MFSSVFCVFLVSKNSHTETHTHIKLMDYHLKSERAAQEQPKSAGKKKINQAALTALNIHDGLNSFQSLLLTSCIDNPFFT